MSLSLLCLGSCASMMAGTESTILVTSSPPGASVITTAGHEVQTPCNLTLRNGEEIELTATHEAHPGDTRCLKSVPDLSRWSAGNIIMIGGLAGMVSDVANPAAYVHKENVHFDFTCSADELEMRARAVEAARVLKQRSYGGTLR